MLDWWNALTEDNQIKVLIVPGTALLGGLGYWLKKLFDKKQQSTTQALTIQGDTNTQTTYGGTAVINTGSGNVSTGDTYHIGVTQEQYEQGLKSREIEVREELKQTQAKNRQQKEIELQAIQQQLQDSSGNYEAYIISLKKRIIQLERLSELLPNEVLDNAIHALAQGDSQQADQLFKQIEEHAENTIIIVAEAAYQRSKIAQDTFHYLEAFNYSQKAVRLSPNNVCYLNQEKIIHQILMDFEKANELLEFYAISHFKSYLERVKNKHKKFQNILSKPKLLHTDLPDQALDVFNKLLTSDSDTSQLNIRMCELNLANDLRVYDESHPAVAKSRNNLGNAYILECEYKKAIECFEWALASDLKTYNENHPAVANSWNSLGFSWDSLGQYQKAIEYYEQALVIMEKRLKNNPYTEVLRNNLADAREKLADAATE